MSLSLAQLEYYLIARHASRTRIIINYSSGVKVSNGIIRIPRPVLNG